MNFKSYFLNTLIEEEFRISTSRILHSVITAGKKGIFEKFLSDLKTQDFVALTTSSSIDVISSKI